MRVKRALISVSDKTGLPEFARGLRDLNIELIASGGTFRKLVDSDAGAVKLSKYTGSPELIGGRVKTLHPKIHAGILADRKNKKHLVELKKQKIPLIDLVVVNLYPFGKVLEEKANEKELIENIDIGGVTLLRAAAKNYSSVGVVSSPKDYGRVLEALIENKGKLTLNLRKKLAAKAFQKTALYDSLISNYFSPALSLPQRVSFGFERVQECRYGENPHQKAAVYKSAFLEPNSVLDFKKLNGKELSFNNFLDLNAAVQLVREFDECSAVVVKHRNPCGVAIGEKISRAFKKAWECDKVSAFGSIIALNRECDFETAKTITSFFNELVVAPSFEEKALNELKKKKNLRVIELDFGSLSRELDFRKISGGLLLQESDFLTEKGENWRTVSEKKPTNQQLTDLKFAWIIAKHVKSNAIVTAKNKATIGIGAGQMNRVKAVEIALENAGEEGEGSVLASDAFFPFRDSIDSAVEKGIKAIVEPGGSIRDKEVIKAANEGKVSLTFTGTRHFEH